MIYHITFMRNEKALVTIPWDKGLESAKAHAREHMTINNADRVEIRDDNNALVYQHPRTMHA